MNNMKSKIKLSGIVLAGGKSTRMGTNKSLLKIDGEPVIKIIVEELQTCTDEVVLITNEKPDVYDFLNVRQFSDRYKDKGPLAGIESALYNVKADVFIFVASDMPFIDRRVCSCLLEQLHGYDAVIPMYNGYKHPLSGIYKKNVYPYVKDKLDEDDLSIRGIFSHINVNYVNNFHGIPSNIVKKHFFNMNNPSQYKEAKDYKL